MYTGYCSAILRALGLMQAFDFLRFRVHQYANRQSNAAFKLANPDVPLPPDYLLYESFQMNLQKYFDGGKDTAQWLVRMLERHISLEGKKILDWGCGPGRVLRHLPAATSEQCQYFGTDYNRETIAWCMENLPGIHFTLNSLEARLPYPDHAMDIIYGISIFTHLSEASHSAWFAELKRVIRPGGILVLTTQGEAFKAKLTRKEKSRFDAGKLVVRGQVREGHRTYSAFHPPDFMRSLFHGMDVLEHMAERPKKGAPLPQDVWIVRKREDNEAEATQT